MEEIPESTAVYLFQKNKKMENKKKDDGEQMTTMSTTYGDDSCLLSISPSSMVRQPTGDFQPAILLEWGGTGLRIPFFDDVGRRQRQT